MPVIGDEERVHRRRWAPRTALLVTVCFVLLVVLNAIALATDGFDWLPALTVVVGLLGVARVGHDWWRSRTPDRARRRSSAAGGAGL